MSFLLLVGLTRSFIRRTIVSSDLCYPHAETVVVGLKPVQSRSVSLVDAGDRGGGLGVLLLLVLGELQPPVLGGCVGVCSHGDELEDKVIWVLLSAAETLVLARTDTDLGNKDQAERDGAAKDDHKGHDAELHVGLVPRQERDGSTDDTHDAHVVNTHPNVLAVVERRDAHVSGLPRQETAKKLEG